MGHSFLSSGVYFKLIIFGDGGSPILAWTTFNFTNLHSDIVENDKKICNVFDNLVTVVVVLQCSNQFR